MWILGGLFSKNPTILYTIGDNKEKKGIFSGSSLLSKLRKPLPDTNYDELDEIGKANYDFVKSVMNEKEPQKISSEEKCCATCQFWDGKRSITPENSVKVENGRVSGDCINPECEKYKRTGWKHLWSCNTCPGTTIPRKSYYKKWDQL